MSSVCETLGSISSIENIRKMGFRPSLEASDHMAWGIWTVGSIKGVSGRRLGQEHRLGDRWEMGHKMN